MGFIMKTLLIFLYFLLANLSLAESNEIYIKSTEHMKPKINSKVFDTTSPKLVLHSPIENTVKLYLNNIPLKFDKKGKFYIKALLNSNKNNDFVLMAESADGDTINVSRKVFFKKETELNKDNTVSPKPMTILSEPEDGYVSDKPNVEVSGTLRESADLKNNGVLKSNFAVANSYVWRGMLQGVAGDPSVSGGLDFEISKSLYLGTWASNVNYENGSY